MQHDELTSLVVAALRRIAPEVDADGLDPDVELRDQIDFDSMDFLNFVDELHEATGIEVPERDYPRIATVAGCARYLAERTPGHVAPAPDS
jgi:acyl carrier protein